jgi:hypothetical protein
LFFLFHFSPLYRECNPSPLLRSYKREGKGPQQRRTHSNQLEFTAIKHSHSNRLEFTHHPSQETWDPLPLLKACNPYYEHFSATRVAAKPTRRRVVHARTSIHTCVHFAHHPGLDAQIQIYSSLCLYPRFSRHRQSSGSLFRYISR